MRVAFRRGRRRYLIMSHRVWLLITRKLLSSGARRASWRQSCLLRFTFSTESLDLFGLRALPRAAHCLFATPDSCSQISLRQTRREGVGVRDQWRAVLGKALCAVLRGKPIVLQDLLRSARQQKGFRLMRLLGRSRAQTYLYRFRYSYFILGSIAQSGI